VAGCLAVAGLALPADASGQGERFQEALRDVQAALEGTYGDEGQQQVPARLDELSGALAEWDRFIREAEVTARSRLPRAGQGGAADIHIAMGRLYLQRGRFADALGEFEQASRLVPERTTTHLYRALALEALDRSDEAGLAYREAWTLQPDDPAAAYLGLMRSGADGPELSRMRETLLATSRSVVAASLRRPSAPFLDRAMPAGGTGGTPVFAMALYADAFGLHARGRHEEGIARLREAAKRDPLLVDPAVASEPARLAAAALRQGDLSTARTALETVVKTDPGSSEAHRALATVFDLSGDLASRVAHLEAALRLRPDDERSWIALARAHTESDALPDAVRTLTAGLEAVPRSGELWWRLAGLSVRLDRDIEALEQYEETARLGAFSGQAALYQWVATLASLQQDLGRTVVAVERRVRLNLNDGAAHLDLASVYTKLGRLDEAFAELAVAAWLSPDDAATFVALGQSHLASGREADAVEALRRAVALRPDLGEAQYALGQALTRTGRRDEGRQRLLEFQRLRAEAMDRDRRDGAIADLKGEARQQSLDGQHELAAKTWVTVIGVEPGVAQNHLEAAEALVRAGRLEESLPFFAGAAELEGVAELHLRIADVLARLGRASESALARQTFERLRLEDLQRRTRR
jgi:tetratricopeptide (TPR) repeat protein